MPMTPRTNLCLIVWIVMLFLSVWACTQDEPTLPEPTEDHLRERVERAYAHFLNSRFEEFMAMRSVQMRKMMFESEEDQQKGFKEWSMFLSREKLIFQTQILEINGTRATVLVKGSILKIDGSRKSATPVYDFWVFENGNWFLDDSHRSSPEFFQK